MKTVYRIFPSIGVARIGNSEEDYFIGPEAPGIVPKGPYRDSLGRIKRQAARFRIFEFLYDEFGREECRREICAGSEVKIRWTVHLANRKAAGARFPPGGDRGQLRNGSCDREGLVIDAGEKAITGANANGGPLAGEINFIEHGDVRGSARVELGSLRTDDQGRLMVIGGPGISRSPLGNRLSDFANNDGWYDGVSDGPIKAELEFSSGLKVPADPAWVVVAVPSYAPGIESVVTWYDEALNVAAKYFHPIMMSIKPSFTRDIYPILRRPVILHWVVGRNQAHHGQGGNFLEKDRLAQLSVAGDAAKASRAAIFAFLTRPNSRAPRHRKVPDAPPNMPKLYSGLDPEDPNFAVYASLTDFQYAVMERWMAGEFEPDWEGPPVAKQLEELPLSEQPDALTRAALEACVGGPFYPGIESTYVIAQHDTYESAFRIRRTVPPGYLTERMALPWQADFVACGEFWWPAQRPVEVETEGGYRKAFARGISESVIGQWWSGYSDMVKYWTELGFVVEKDSKYVETERRPINGET